MAEIKMQKKAKQSRAKKLYNFISIVVKTVGGGGGTFM